MMFVKTLFNLKQEDRIKIAGAVLQLSHWEAKVCSDQTCAASGGHGAL